MASKINPYWTIYLLTVPTGTGPARYVGITRQRLKDRMHGHLYDARRERTFGRLQRLLAWYDLPVIEFAHVLATAATEMGARRIERHYVRYFARKGELLNTDLYYRRLTDQPEFEFSPGPITTAAPLEEEELCRYGEPGLSSHDDPL